MLYTTFRRALELPIERGLIKSDDYIHACLQMFKSYGMTITNHFQEYYTAKIVQDDDGSKYGSNRHISDSTIYGIEDLVVKVDDILARHSLNSDQKNAYDAIMRHVDADSSGVFFIDGPGGTGKTFLYKALLATFHSRGLIALATASSGAAANNMTGGRTAHPRFKIPINVTTNLICNIKKQSG
ncbi:ATP-dependent DNA helicase PIF1-like protein [Tanacetum coccineum]